MNTLKAGRLFTLALLLAGLAGGLPAQAQKQNGRLEYKLGAGDDIRISVFQNPDLTLETRVADDGHITYPLIGRMQLGGLSVATAERSIAQALERGKFLQRPQVNIVPLRTRSTQVSVLGQVREPGRFALETVHTRVSEMLAMAGGVDPNGADVAIVTGQRAGKPYRKEIDIPALFLAKNLDEDVLVAAGDVIFVQRAPVYYVYGEVQGPGSYKIQRDMTVRQALAQGGGLTPRGTDRRLQLHRRDAAGKLTVIRPTLDDPVLADDVLNVREAWF